MDPETAKKSEADATVLHTVLDRLQLGRYEKRLAENGFEDWETVTAITESDMVELDIKLGDRRKLQRAIREYDDMQTESQQATRTTRQYRRHPRPDHNAPQRPKTAYVLFGEHVRKDPTLSDASFVDIAKETGKRWAELPREERANEWEKPAAETLQAYKQQLERYMQTEDYRSYQTYLQEFERRQTSTRGATLDDDEGTTSLNPVPSNWSSAPPELYNTGTTPHENIEMDDPSQDTSWTVKRGMEEVRQISQGRGIDPQLIFSFTALPPAQVTMKAVHAFLQGTGTLLYLWDQEDALNLVTSVYQPQISSSPGYAAEVFAMSAVASYCDGENQLLLAQEGFLHLFLSALCSPPAMCALRHMRLFACLAICRFTNNVESARRLMLSALCIGRQLFGSPVFIAETPEEDLRHWWLIFRSIVFLESWFAYNTGSESRVTHQDLDLYHPALSHDEDWLKILQQRVGELGQLAAYIALDLKTAASPPVMQAQVHLESLNKWHRNLPQPMRLSRLSLADPLSIALHTRRSILQLHILFLGLFIEPYRNCLVDLGNFRMGITTIKPEILEALERTEEQAVLAARQSARVATLLQHDALIRSHCWVSVYTSFTGAAVLLFSASQKLLQCFGEEVSQELLYVSSHLNVLSLCSFDSELARKLCMTLQVLFNEIREVVVSSAYRRMRERRSAGKDAVASLSDTDVGDSVVEKTILDLAKRTADILEHSLSL